MCSEQKNIVFKKENINQLHSAQFEIYWGKDLCEVQNKIIERSPLILTSCCLVLTIRCRLQKLRCHEFGHDIIFQDLFKSLLNISTI